MKQTLFSLAVSLLVLAGCKQDDELVAVPVTDQVIISEEEPVGTLDLDIRIENALGALILGQPFDEAGIPVSIEELRFYISYLELEDTEGNRIPLSDIELFSYENEAMTRSYEIPPGEYTQLHLHVGVPPEWNTDTDPVSFPNAHPLGFTGSQGMFWTWNTGYIFTKYDGRVSTDASPDVVDEAVFYHAGNDALFTSRSFDIALEIEDQESATIALLLNADELTGGGVSPIDVAVETGTHSSGSEGLALAQKFIENFAAALEIVE